MGLSCKKQVKKMKSIMKKVDNQLELDKKAAKRRKDEEK